MRRLSILFVMTSAVFADDRPVGTALYNMHALPPAQGQRRDDMKLYLLGIDRNDDGSPGYRLRVYSETAVYRNNPSFQWGWCNWSGFIKNSVTNVPDPGPPDEAGRIEINASGTFHASIGGGLGRCMNTRMFDPDDLISGEVFTGKWLKAGDTYVLKGKWLFPQNPSISMVYDITLPTPESLTASGCRYPKARKLTPAEIQKLAEDLRSAAAEARELHVTADPFDAVVAAFRACGYRLQNRVDLPLGIAGELKGPLSIGIMWWKATNQTYIAYE